MPTQIQIYQINQPQLSGYIVSVASEIIPSGNSLNLAPIYFGYSGFTITGASTISNALISGQGHLTNNVIVTSGASNFIANINLPLTNAFAGAIQKFLINMPATINSNFKIIDSASSIVLVGQSGQSSSFTTYIEVACSGGGWYLNTWI